MEEYNAALFDVDRAVRGHEFVGGHAGVADDDQTGLRVEAGELLDFLGLAPPGRVGPHVIVNGVVEIDKSSRP